MNFPRAVRRWSIAGLGVAMAAASLGLQLVADTRTGMLGLVVPLLLSAAVFAYGISLGRSSEFDAPGQVVRWSLLGAGALGLLGAWWVYVDLGGGVSAGEAAYQVTTDAVVGAAIGTVVGRYGARVRAEARASERRKRELAAVVDNAPLVLFELDEEGTITLSQGQGLAAIGMEPGELVGASVYEAYADSPDAIEGFERALAGEPANRTLDLGSATMEAWFEPIRTDGEVTSVLGTAIDVTDRVERDRQLERLHEACRELTYATDQRAVAQRTVDIAEQVLDKPLSTLWRYDPDGDCLRAVAMSESTRPFLGVEVLADIDPIESDRLGMDVYRSGEPRVIDDYSTVENPALPDARLGAVLVLPLGDHGILEVGQHDVAAVGEAERQRAEILALNARAALDRAEREDELRTRTDQMEFFNSILRHDVLNGMTVIRARGQILAEELDGRHAEYAETIVGWVDDVTDVVERVRTVLETLTSEDERELGPVDASAVVDDRVDRIRHTYPDVTVETDLPDGVRVLGDELLAEVVGNLLTNAVEHNDPTGLTVRVSLSTGDGTATLRVADDGKGISEERKQAVFRRGETGHAKASGSGFGLFFVDAMVDAYGGAVEVEDNDEGGATFVVELPLATATTERA